MPLRPVRSAWSSKKMTETSKCCFLDHNIYVLGSCWTKISGISSNIIGCDCCWIVFFARYMLQAHREDEWETQWDKGPGTSLASWFSQCCMINTTQGDNAANLVARLSHVAMLVDFELPCPLITWHSPLPSGLWMSYHEDSPFCNVTMNKWILSNYLILMIHDGQAPAWQSFYRQ